MFPVMQYQRRGTDCSSNHTLPKLSSRVSTINMSKTDHHQTSNASPTSSRKNSVILPRLVDETEVFSVINRFRGTPPSTSRSVELTSNSNFERQLLRQRSSSVDIFPNLSLFGSLSQGLISKSFVTNSIRPDDDELGSEESDADDDDEDAPTPVVSIDPFPNVASFLADDTNETNLPRPPTPPKRKPKKKYKKPEDTDAAKRRKSKRLGRKRWKPPQHTAATRRHNHEVSKRHPVRKQFLYSEIMDDELKSYIPQRQPGGKLKPIYRRNPNNGDIIVPETPIEIAFERLSSGGRPEVETAAMINKRRREELQALLERRKKSIGKKKKRKRVRFRLPKTHIPSDSEESEPESVNSSADHLTNSIPSLNEVVVAVQDNGEDMTTDHADVDVENDNVDQNVQSTLDSDDNIIQEQFKNMEDKVEFQMETVDHIHNIPMITGGGIQSN